MISPSITALHRKRTSGLPNLAVRQPQRPRPQQKGVTAARADRAVRKLRNEVVARKRRVLQSGELPVLIGSPADHGTVGQERYAELATCCHLRRESGQAVQHRADTVSGSVRRLGRRLLEHVSFGPADPCGAFQRAALRLELR